MIELGLTSTQRREYEATLIRSHQMRVTVQVLDNSHGVISTVNHTLMDGQVDVTTPSRSGDDVEVGRTLMLTLLDPGQSLALDSSSPADGALYLDRMIRVIYSVRCSFGWVDVPVFTGPVVKVDRDGWMVNVEAHGKERFALDDAWTLDGPYTGYKTSVIRALLSDAGEILARMNIPSSSSKVKDPISVGRQDKRWVAAWKVSASLDRVLFYDGRGIVQCRSLSNAVMATFGAKHILADPQISYSSTDTHNAVRVTGGKASKSKTPVFSVATAPSWHPLSASKLAVNGKPRYLPLFEENDNYKTTTACRARANRLLDLSLDQATDTTVEVVPRPDLEPWDLVAIERPLFRVTTRPKAFTLPLVQRAGTGTPMTIGFTKDVRRPTRAVGKK